MNWIKRHKFWTVVIILFIYGVLTTVFMDSDIAPVSTFIAMYIVLGYPIKWIVDRMKRRSKYQMEADNAEK